MKLFKILIESFVSVMLLSNAAGFKPSLIIAGLN